MEKDWLKDKMIERFEDYQSGLDLEQAWIDLDKRRNPRKQNRRLLIIWLSIGIIGISLLGFYILNQPTKSNRLLSLDHQTISNSEYLEKPENELSTKKLTVKKDIHEEGMLKGNLTQISDTNRNNLNIRDKSTEDKTIKLADNNGINSKSRGQELNSVPFWKGAYTPDNTIQLISKINEPVHETPSINLNRQIEIIPFLPTLLNKHITEDPRDITIIDSKTINLSMGQFPIVKKSRNSFGISIAYGWHNRHLNGFGVDRLGFIDAKKSQEKALDAISTNLFYRNYFYDDFFTEIDLGFQQTTYEFKDQKINIEKQNLDDQIVAIHNYPDGKEETIFGTIEQTETKVRNNTFYQKFKQIHMHLIVGKEIDLSSSFGLGISGGLEYGLFAQAQGVSFSNTLDFRNYGNISDLKYKEGGILSGLLRVELLKGLNARSEIGIAIMGKSSLGNLFAYNEIIEKRNYLMSRISYTYRF